MTTAKEALEKISVPRKHWKTVVFEGFSNIIKSKLKKQKQIIKNVLARKHVILLLVFMIFGAPLDTENLEMNVFWKWT